MEKLKLFMVLAVACAGNAAAFSFLGPKWPGTNPVLHYYINEQGCEDVPDEWDHIHRGVRVWADVPSTAIECWYDGTTNIRKIAPDKKMSCSGRAPANGH